MGKQTQASSSIAHKPNLVMLGAVDQVILVQGIMHKIGTLPTDKRLLEPNASWHEDKSFANLGSYHEG